MTIIGVKKDLEAIAEQVAKVKDFSTDTVRTARMLMSEDYMRQLKEISLTIASDMATIENNWNEFTRIGPKSDKFAVKQ